MQYIPFIEVKSIQYKGRRFHDVEKIEANLDGAGNPARPTLSIIERKKGRRPPTRQETT